jgi:hypothetical protein
LFALEELILLNPKRKIRMLCSDHEIKNVLENFEDKFQKLIYPKNSHMDFNIACALYLAA